MNTAYTRNHLISRIDVRRAPLGSAHHGVLTAGTNSFPCCLGRGGITAKKHEGDGATPAGSFAILGGYYRPGRLRLRSSPFAMLPIRKTDGWCDAPDNPNYNSEVSLPFDASHEKLYREDRLYDLILILDYNIHPRVRNRGSAIFFHLTRPDRGPTEGCVAVDPAAMLRLLPRLSPDVRIHIHP